MEIIIAILSLIIVLLSYGIYNIMIKYEVLEDGVSESDAFIETTLTSIQNAYTRMKAIDRIGSFESDDESGEASEE